MSLDIGAAMSEGFRRTFTPAGLLLAVAFVLIGVVSTIAFQTVLADVFEWLIELMRANRGTGEGEFTRQEIRAVESSFRGQTPFALPIPLSIVGLLFVLSAVAAEGTRLVAVRLFFGERTDSVSGDALRRNIVVATANGIVGGIIVTVIIVLGSILGLALLVVGALVVGFFLAMSFLFLRQEIAIADKNFVDALFDSWSLAKGNRLELLALVLLVVTLATIVSLVLIISLAFISPLLSTLAGLFIGGVTTVFGTAVVTRAYAQLHTESVTEERRGTDDEWAVY